MVGVGILVVVDTVLEVVDYRNNIINKYFINDLDIEVIKYSQWTDWTLLHWRWGWW